MPEKRPVPPYHPAMRLLRAATVAASIALVPAAAALAQDTPPQSMSDLRQEIDRLRQELTRRDADLDAAKAQIAALKAEIAALKAAAQQPASQSGGSAPATAPAPAPVPADPTIGPGGLLSALQAEYLAAFPSLPDISDQQKLNLHLRSLEPWCAKANRDGIRQYSWVGAVEQSSVRAQGRNVAFVVVFRNGTREFKQPFVVDQGMLTRIRGRDGGLSGGDLQFNVIVKPKLTVNGARPAPGAFENPPMVGPYIDFLLDLELKSVVPTAAEPSK